MFCNILTSLWNIQFAFGPIYSIVNGQRLSKHSRHLVTLFRYDIGYRQDLTNSAIFKDANEDEFSNEICFFLSKLAKLNNNHNFTDNNCA